MLFSDPFLFSLVCNTQHGQNTTAGKQQSDPQEHIAVIAGLGGFLFSQKACQAVRAWLGQSGL